MSAAGAVGSAPAGSPPLLQVRGLSCRIATPRGPLTAVDDVALTLERGRTLGLVGESGSGKSMLVRSVMGLTPRSATVGGQVLLDGVDLRRLSGRERRAVWGRRVAMVFQDPMTSLNPVVRIGRQITESMRAHLGIGAHEADRRAVALLGLVGIPEPERRMRQYPHQFSGGMRQRVTIAIALACDPDLLIADEATTALDVTIQQQILDLFAELQEQRTMAMILVSHDLGVMATRTDEIAVMYGGRIVEQAPTPELFRRPRHRYTTALLRSIPRVDRPRHQLLATIPGAPPDLVNARAACCRFAPRCEATVDRCRAEQPPLAEDSPGHRFACFVPVGAPGGGSGRGTGGATDEPTLTGSGAAGEVGRD